MAGFKLQGFFDRVPCPYCESTDCCGVRDNELICAKTERVVTEAALRRSALRHDLAQYTSHNAGDGWWLHEVTSPSATDSPLYHVGTVELYHEKQGVRGACADLATAQAWVDEHRGNPLAYSNLPTNR